MTIKSKEGLVDDIYEWVVKGSEVGIEKERLLKVMIEATLDYLYLKDYIREEANGKKVRRKN